MLGVQQIDRIVEVVEETLKGLLKLCLLEITVIYIPTVFFLVLLKKLQCTIRGFVAHVAGNTVRLMGTKKINGRKAGGSSLQLPKIRKNPLIEIIPISTG